MRRLKRVIFISAVCTMLPLAFVPFLEAAVWIVEPAFRLGGEYNDNVRLTSGPKRGVFGSTISPSLTLDASTERLGVTGNVSADIRRYRKAKDLNTDSYLLSLSPHYQMEYGGLRLNTAYRRDTTLESELEETGLVLERRERSRLTLGSSWSGSITEYTSLGISYSFSKTDDLQGERPGLFEFRNQQGSTNLSYRLTRSVQLNTTFSYAAFRVPSLGSRSNTYSANAGISHQFSETFQGSLGIGGYYTVQKERGTVDRQSGFSFSGSMSKGFEKTQISASASRSVNPSSSGSLLQGDSFSLSLGRQLTVGLSGSISGSLHENRFLRANEPRRKSRFYRIGQGFQWRWGERWRISTSYSYSRQKSDGGSGSTSANAASLTLSYQFQKLVFSP